MSRVRSKGTKPEMVVRRLLHDMGYRYRLHDRKLPGTPDIVFSKRRCILWIHGCFWHAHDCKRGNSLPNSNRQFWEEKKMANIERDRRALASVENLGWKVMVVWECELKDPGLEAKLRSFLGTPSFKPK